MTRISSKASDKAMARLAELTKPKALKGIESASWSLPAKLIIQNLATNETCVELDWTSGKLKTTLHDVDEGAKTFFKAFEGYFEKALAQARQDGIKEGESHFHELIDKAYNNGKAEELNRQIKLRDEEIKDIYNTGRASERERCVKALMAKDREHFELLLAGKITRKEMEEYRAGIMISVNVINKLSEDSPKPRKDFGIIKELK